MLKTEGARSKIRNLLHVKNNKISAIDVEWREHHSFITFLISKRESSTRDA
jgi:hypothetical protein